MENFRLVPSRHARNTTRLRGTRASHQAKHEARKTSDATVFRAQTQSNRRRSQPTTRRTVHQRDKESNMDSKPSPSPQKGHRGTEDVCRVWAHQEALPKRPLPPAKNRSNNRLHSRMRPPILPRRILRIQSDQDEGRRRREHFVHHPLRRILLPNNALWPKKCRSHIPANDASMLERPYW